MGSVDGISRLGLRYCNGQGVAKDVTAGLMLITEAATLGLLGACWRLGELYAEGKAGVPKEKSLARKWYEKAVSVGDSKGAEHLTESEAGRYAKSVVWLRANATGPAPWKQADPSV